ncbi:MAG: HAMP domain-containing sensor histidine kinase [Gemmatimonadota bacterium]|jgi:nitrogen fixation/metabolism regulation signal transduction histidine kinase
MIRIRSFQSRVFAVLLVMALVPTVLALAAGALALGELGSTVGTLGPWDAVAESGLELAEVAVRAAPENEEVAAAARTHRSALSSSLQRSRLWALVSERVRTLLPLAALLAVVLIGGLALVAARWLSRSLARPIHDLVGWTGRIARGEPLPPPEPGAGGVREFAALRDALRSMAGELEEARRREVEGARLRAWTDMARRVAHEIKNPLTPMRMAAATLARSDDPSTADPAGVLLEEIGRLDEMARTFSQLGRMPEGPRSEVDLVELAQELARHHERPGVAIRVTSSPDLPLVLAHYEVLSRAVRNLLVNALEAVESVDTADASEVEIAVEREDGFVRLLVRDRGPGIPEEVLESLWFPDVTTKKRGTGLGLAIVRQAAEAHGGRVAARNRSGGGAELELALPLDRNGVPAGDDDAAGRRDPAAAGTPGGGVASGPDSP